MTDQELKNLFGSDSGMKSRYISGLGGSALGFTLAKSFRRLGTSFALLVPDAKAAAGLEDDLAFFLGSRRDLLNFPSHEILPYYGLSPNPDAVAGRASFLYTLLRRKEPFLAILSMSSMMRRLPPKKIFDDYSDYLVAGEEIDREGFLKKLVEAGYLNVPVVEDAGTFSKRGGILDVFPPGSSQPLRLEFFGDKIESLRFFDPETQRSGSSTEDLVIIPAREILFNDETLARAARRFREKANDFGLAKAERDGFLESLKHRMDPPALDTYLSLFYEETSSIFSYFPKAMLTVWIEPELARRHFEEIRAEAAAGFAACQTTERIVKPEDIFLNWEELESQRQASKYWSIGELATTDADQSFQVQTHEGLSILLKQAHLGEEMLRPLLAKLSEWMEQGVRILLVAGTHTQLLRMKDLLERSGIPVREIKGGFPEFVQSDAPARAVISLLDGHMRKGFFGPAEALALITDQEIFGEKQRRKPSRTKKAETFSSFEELRGGDYIVHEEHGLGIYRGLDTMNLDGTDNDFLRIEYLGGDKLYLPVYRLNLVSRYAAQEGFVPRLDRMGGATWERSKGKVRQALRAMAGELLKLYADRATLAGYAFSPRGMLYEEFEATFPFEETLDQSKAIEEVNLDMDEARPMDRLICGDVGFGKTEVAMRAAFRAVLDNKQVAVLVPTTVLALQHERNFRMRFKEFPAVIEMLSRFVAPKRQKELTQKLKEGKVDIVIGTHGLLGKEIRFKDLGLLIVDEEHRFGVAQKEKIKKLKKLSDVLTLTATPIPRTLNMSLSGIRDLSVIATPPVDRMSIQTFVANYNEALIREAILRELARGGQVYFVHNRVQTIQGVARRLVELVPEAKVEIGHGQLVESELEDAMIRFVNREFNVFVCTSIVESGLDIPSANTMVINRADTFGLAQLYQLRGRIGRSNVRAFAYLLIPGQEAITPQARARLAVLQRYTDLGSGFKIAAHDLEIRGSGNLLGAEQSGYIAAVGYDLYMKLLEEAILEVKGDVKAEAPDPELHLKLPASISESYIPETTMRLTLYKRFAAVRDEEELEVLAEEVRDRFGELPETVRNLLIVMRVKVLARRAWIRLIRLEARRVVMIFDPKSPVDVAALTALLKKEPERLRWLAPHELAMGVKAGKMEKAIESVIGFLANLRVL